MTWILVTMTNAKKKLGKSTEKRDILIISINRLAQILENNVQWSGKALYGNSFYIHKIFYTGS